MLSKGKYLYARCFIDGIGTDFNLNMGNKLMLDAAVYGSAEALEYLKTRAPYVLESVKDKRVLAALEATSRLLVGDDRSELD